MIDRVTARLERRLYEVPVGFKWFVAGLLSGDLGFGGEESAGASFSRFDGSAWSTDKDGITPALLAAEITARIGRDPGEAYRALARELGEPFADRIEARATPDQKKKLAKLDRSQIRGTELAGERIEQVLNARTGKQRAHRRHQGLREERLVRRAAVRHRGHIQDLRRELSRRGASARHLERGADHRGCASQVLVRRARALVEHDKLRCGRTRHRQAAAALAGRGGVLHGVARHHDSEHRGAGDRPRAARCRPSA